MTKIDEIAPDLFRLSVYVPDFNMQFNHFLVRDEQPLLFHAGLKGMFPVLREAVASLIDPAKLRWVAWSHFESDECGALNEWLQLAPHAEPACTLVGKLVNADDSPSVRRVASRPTKRSPRVSIVSASIARHISRTAGTPACYSRRRKIRFSAPISSTTSATPLR